MRSAVDLDVRGLGRRWKHGARPCSPILGKTAWFPCGADPIQYRAVEGRRE